MDSDPSDIGLVYLATPYSHPDPAVRQERFERVNRCAAELIRKGFEIYSPISHSHAIVGSSDLPIDWEFWKRLDLAMIRRCRAMFVYRQPGWQESVGVTAEIQLARELGLAILYIDP